MAPVGIVLAAGRGRRFDPSGLRNKLLQPLAGGEAVVVASARALLAVVPNVIAVVRADDGGVAQVLRALGCDVTLCVDADDGMAASLVHAIAYSLPAPHGWLIALGDMPHIKPDTIRAVANAIAQGAAFAMPVYQGQRGHPVGIHSKFRPDLLALKGDAGARAIIAAHKSEVQLIATQDPGILIDVDTAADYQKLLR